MNALLRIVVPAAAVVGMTACAGSRDMAVSDPPPSLQPRDRIVQDNAYVSQVERIARRRGVQVMWIHPPTRRETVPLQ